MTQYVIEVKVVVEATDNADALDQAWNLGQAVSAMNLPNRVGPIGTSAAVYGEKKPVQP